ncbi:TolC family protein [Variovorax robiniae]|uniref:TolC family protein n=1 Tax=Variovorax robiniae TaxID=1836199 RepID=A0ABU8X894_9BURK
MRRFVLPFAAAFLVVPGAFAQGTPSPSFSPPPETAKAGSAQARPPLTLAAAVDLAMALNPELAAASLEVDAVAGARLQAAARPNPELAFLLEDTRQATRTTTLQINQPIELGGKRDARIAAADRGSDVARLELQTRRQAVRAAVATAYFDLLAVQERVRVAEAALAVVQRSSRAATQRVAAGKVSPVEETKARVAEAGVRIELTQVRSEEIGARSRLATAIGQPIDGYALDGSLGTLPPMPSDETFRSKMENAPAVNRAELEVARRTALTAVENSRKFSDVTVSLGGKRNNELGLNQAVIGVTVPLPLFDRNQGNILEALRREDKARDEANATRAIVRSESTQVRERLLAARTEAIALGADVLPGAQSAFDASTRGFELGKFSFLEVLDAQRTLLQARTQYLRALAEAHRAAADLNRILGVDAMPATP